MRRTAEAQGLDEETATAAEFAAVLAGFKLGYELRRKAAMEQPSGEECIPAAEFSALVGRCVTAVTTAARKGQLPGAVRITVGKRTAWMIPSDLRHRWTELVKAGRPRK